MKAAKEKLNENKSFFSFDNEINPQCNYLVPLFCKITKQRLWQRLIKTYKPLQNDITCI